MSSTTVPIGGGTPDSFGGYEIERELGRGGQGVVYLAREEKLHRKVALKVLTGFAASDASVRERFEREARVCARLDHPNICTVFEIGEHEGIPFIAMQHVSGETLASRISQARSASFESLVSFVDFEAEEFEEGNEEADTELSTVKSSGSSRADLDQMLEIFEKIAAALDYAHENGVVHRDIKPGNVMVTPTGEPIILDFGLAQDSESDAGLTLTGDVFGTPAYMAPEQVLGQISAVDRRTDVWALGAMFYECLTLNLPFAAPTRARIMQLILKDEPQDPHKLNPSLPRDLSVVLLTAMSKGRNHRYQTAADLAEDLRRIRLRMPIKARAIGTFGRLARWTSRNPVVAGLLACVLLLLVSGLAVTWRKNIDLKDANQRISEESLKAEVAAKNLLAESKEKERIEGAREAEERIARYARRLGRAMTLRRNDPGLAVELALTTPPGTQLTEKILVDILGETPLVRAYSSPWDGNRGGLERIALSVDSGTGEARKLALVRGRHTHVFNVEENRIERRLPITSEANLIGRFTGLDRSFEHYLSRRSIFRHPSKRPIEELGFRSAFTGVFSPLLRSNGGRLPSPSLISSPQSPSNIQALVYFWRSADSKNSGGTVVVADLASSSTDPTPLPHLKSVDICKPVLSIHSPKGKLLRILRIGVNGEIACLTSNEKQLYYESWSKQSGHQIVRLPEVLDKPRSLEDLDARREDSPMRACLVKSPKGDRLFLSWTKLRRFAVIDAMTGKFLNEPDRKAPREVEKQAEILGPLFGDFLVPIGDRSMVAVHSNLFRKNHVRLVWAENGVEAETLVRTRNAPVSIMKLIGSRLVVGDEEGGVEVFELATGKNRVLFPLHSREVEFIEGEGDVIVTGKKVRGDEVYVWDLSPQYARQTLPGRAKDSPPPLEREDWLLSASNDGGQILINKRGVLVSYRRDRKGRFSSQRVDTPSGRLFGVPQHSDWPTLIGCQSTDPDNSDKILMLTEDSDGMPVARVIADDFAVQPGRGIAALLPDVRLRKVDTLGIFVLDHRRMGYTDCKGALKILDIRKPEKEPVVLFCEGALPRAVSAKNGIAAFVALDTGAGAALDLNSGKEIARFGKPDERNPLSGFSSDAAIFVVHEEGELVWYDTRTGKPISRKPSPVDSNDKKSAQLGAFEIRVASDGDHVTLSRWGMSYVVSRSKPGNGMVFEGKESSPILALVPNSRNIFFGDLGGAEVPEYAMLDVKTGEFQLTRPPVEPNFESSAEYSSTDNLLMLFNPGRIDIWDLSSLGILGSIDNADDPPVMAQLSPDKKSVFFLGKSGGVWSLKLNPREEARLRRPRHLTLQESADLGMISVSQQKTLEKLIESGDWVDPSTGKWKVDIDTYPDPVANLIRIRRQESLFKYWWDRDEKSWRTLLRAWQSAPRAETETSHPLGIDRILAQYDPNRDAESFLKWLDSERASIPDVIYQSFRALALESMTRIMAH